MNFIRFNSIFTYSVRWLIAAFTCTLLFFSSAFPAAAMGNSQSSPSEGTENLGKIQERTDKSIYDPPTTLKQVEERSQPERGGINEVQGAADLNKMKGTNEVQKAADASKMKNSDNPQQANSAIDNAKRILKNLQK